MVRVPAERESVACAAGHAPGDRSALVRSILEDLILAECGTDATVILPTTFSFSPKAHAAEHSRLLAGLSAALLQSRWLEALSICQRVLRSGREQPANNVNSKLAELKRSLEQELLVPSRMDLVGADRRIHLLPSRSVLIGRPGGERQADIGIDCRFLSRGERNLSLFSQDNRWLLEDLGSTNGSFIDGVRLKQGETTSLPVGLTQLQIGRAGAAAAPIVIEFRRPVKDPGAVVVRLRHTGSALGLAESWPTAQQDISRRWIVFRNQIGASSEEDCALRLPAPTQGIVAALRYQNGFWVVPSTGSKVSVNEVEFEAPAPLPSGASVCLGHTLFRTEAAAEQTETPA